MNFLKIPILRNISDDFALKTQNICNYSLYFLSLKNEKLIDIIEENLNCNIGSEECWPLFADLELRFYLPKLFVTDIVITYNVCIAIFCCFWLLNMDACQYTFWWLQISFLGCISIFSSVKRVLPDQKT